MTLLLATFGALLLSASSATAEIAINEVETQGSPDFVELKNTGSVPVDISGYVLRDSGNNNPFTVPVGTTIAAGGYYVPNLTGFFGLSDDDSARLFDNAATPLDSYSWTAHANVTWGRCPDGTGEFGQTGSSTAGASNNCPVALPPPPPLPTAVTWPGGTSVAEADVLGTFGDDMSGLAYQPSGTSAPGVLWAVSAARLYRLQFNGTNWVSDTTNGWSSAGKQLRYPDGTGLPDSEGLTLAPGDPNGIYVATERNDSGAFGNTSRPAVLRYDVTTPGGVLNATRDWNFSTDLTGLNENAGLEAITWIPDSLLVDKGFTVQGGALYDPANYPGHGTGLFAVGVEQTGDIVLYALNQGADTFTKVTTIRNGFGTVMDLTYEPQSTHLWAACDNTCNGQTGILDIAQSGADDGKFVFTARYDRPAGMPNLNNEGFALGSQAECVSGRKPAFWLDDTNANGHALRTGTLNCTVPATPTPTPTPGAQPGPPGPVVTPTPGPVVTPTPPAGDRIKPTVKLSLKFTKTGSFAVRRSGKFGLEITVSEATKLTISATVRKTKKSKAKTIIRTNTNDSGAGGKKRTLTLSLDKGAKKGLSKGATVTVTVVAKDAAGNTTTQTATAKVK